MDGVGVCLARDGYDMMNIYIKGEFYWRKRLVLIVNANQSFEKAHMAMISTSSITYIVS